LRPEYRSTVRSMAVGQSGWPNGRPSGWMLLLVVDYQATTVAILDGIRQTTTWICVSPLIYRSIALGRSRLVHLFFCTVDKAKIMIDNECSLLSHTARNLDSLHVINAASCALGLTAIATNKPFGSSW